MAPELAHFQSAIRNAAVGGAVLRLRGGGSKDFYGGPLRGTVLDTKAWSGVVEHDPGELILCARAGTPLAEIEALLASHGQRLPFDPPHFGAGATLGGAVASGLCGPLRLVHGPVRDHVLGVTMMDGRGEVLRFGGRVIKNVAGYDLSRLMAGSLGVLGLLLEITVKLLPRPALETTLCFEMPQEMATLQVNRWLGLPGPLAASAWADGVLSVRLAGGPAAVAAVRKQLGGESMDDTAAAALWHGLREHTDPFFERRAGDAVLWRVSVPAAAPPLALAGDPLVEWGGGQRWVYGDEPKASVLAAAAAVHGHATAFRGGDRVTGVFTPVSAAALEIQRRLKDAFDPHRVFDPGRLHPDI